MMKQEIDQDIELDKMDNTSGDENPYRELIVNNQLRQKPLYLIWSNGQYLVM